MNWQTQKIISTANSLHREGTSSASTGEVIAAAFVLDDMDYLPADYSPVEAWARLGSWQTFVDDIRENHMEWIE